MASSMTAIPTYEGDLFAVDALADSRATFKLLRDLGDAVWVPALDLYVVARFDDVVKALRASNVLISGQGVSVNAQLNGANSVTNPATITSDGEQHRRLKKIEMKPLQPSAMAALRERIHAMAEERVNALNNGATFEGMEELASYLPTRVVIELVGIRNIDRERMARWSYAIFDAFGPADHSRTGAALPTILELVDYSMRLGREDLVPGGIADQMLEAGERGEVTDQEARGLMFDFVIPAVDTTVLAIGEMLRGLATVPGAFDKVRANPELIPGVVDEAVRLSTPLRGFTRLVKEDFQLTQSVLPKGSRVWLLYAAANLDERHYPNPDLFDVERNPRDQLGWGHGVHLCTGKHLARLEMEAVLGALLRNVARIEVDMPTRIVNNSAQGYATLPVRLHPR
jgi:cytochrome P450